MEENGISKNRICKDLDQQRGNFNRYCRDEFQRIDANLIIKLCEYLDYYQLKKGYMVSFNFNKKKQVGVHEIAVGDKVLVEAVV